jgi:ribosomal protein L37E
MSALYTTEYEDLPIESMPFFAADNVYLGKNGHFVDFEDNMFCSGCGQNSFHLFAGRCPDCEFEIKRFIRKHTQGVHNDNAQKHKA